MCCLAGAPYNWEEWDFISRVYAYYICHERHGCDHVHILIVCLPRFQATRSSRCVQLSLLRAQTLWKCLPQRERSNPSESRSNQVWHTPPLWCYGGECWWHHTPRRIYSTHTMVVRHHRQLGKINPHTPAEYNWQYKQMTDAFLQDPQYVSYE